MIGQVIKWSVEAESTKIRFNMISYIKLIEYTATTYQMPVESNKIRTVLLFKVSRSKNGGESSCLFLSLIFLR